MLMGRQGGRPNHWRSLVPSKLIRVAAVLNWEVSYEFVEQTSSIGLDPEIGKEWNKNYFLAINGKSHKRQRRVIKCQQLSEGMSRDGLFLTRVISPGRVRCFSSEWPRACSGFFPCLSLHTFEMTYCCCLGCTWTAWHWRCQVRVARWFTRAANLQ